MNGLLDMKKLKDGCPVMVAKIPSQIMREIDEWVRECKKIKNHPLAELKSHLNYGYRLNERDKEYNSYQVSIPKELVEKSFWMAWVLRLSHKYWGGGVLERKYRIREYPGHYDGYDIWTNFAYKGDENPPHIHAGVLSGVIYYKNHDHPTIFPDYDCSYSGDNGTMVLFPNDVLHGVNKQISNKERITIAFNIITMDK